MNKINELRQKRAELLTRAEAYLDADDFNEETYQEYEEQIDGLTRDIDRRENLEQQRIVAAASAGRRTTDQAPAVIRNRGDNEENALGAFIRRGDMGGVRHIQDGDNSIFIGPETRASNDTTMNITTDADGGYAVPTGHYGQIIARRDEASIVDRLGVRRIPGVGTTVNVPVDNEADGEFVTKAESNAFDRDAPAINQVAFTLLKYTKKVDLTYELLEDEESRLLPFLADFVGRGMAKTMNNLLLTEVAANGTALKTFASATVIAVDELEPIVYNDDMAPYLDDAGSSAWVMRRSVHGEIVLLDDSSWRRYASNQMGMEGQPSLLGFRIVYSQKAGATAASAKSVYFGNWNFVGLYEKPGFSLVRDPYTRSSYGEIILNYMFRVDFGVLQAEAIGYGAHPSA